MYEIEHGSGVTHEDDYYAYEDSMWPFKNKLKTHEMDI